MMSNACMPASDNSHPSQTSRPKVSKTEEFMNQWTGKSLDRISVPPGVQAVMDHLDQLNLSSQSKIIHVDSDYYDWSFEKRMYILPIHD